MFAVTTCITIAKDVQTAVETYNRKNNVYKMSQRAKYKEIITVKFYRDNQYRFQLTRRNESACSIRITDVCIVY